MNDMKDIQNGIMNRILTTQQDKKAWKRKEKTIMFIYIGAIFFALLFLFLLGDLYAVSSKLAEFKTGKKDLIVYYRMFTVSLVFSLITFGVYVVRSLRSHNRPG